MSQPSITVELLQQPVRWQESASGRIIHIKSFLAPEKILII